ncbi:hypothetical protein P5V15_011116 [Pogonomyrmex californicus]
MDVVIFLLIISLAPAVPPNEIQLWHFSSPFYVVRTLLRAMVNPCLALRFSRFVRKKHAIRVKKIARIGGTRISKASIIANRLHSAARAAATAVADWSRGSAT